MKKWKEEERQRDGVRYRSPIRFGASISLPVSGKFPFEDKYNTNPEQFIKEWLGGAVSTIYTGPLYNEPGEFTGELTAMPIIRVRHAPWSFIVLR
jgi:hypothetical protein